MSNTKTKIQDETEDALQAENLDHLVQDQVDTNLTTTVDTSSVMGYILAKTDVANFNRTYDSLEAIGNAMGTEWQSSGDMWDILVSGLDSSGITEDFDGGMLEVIKAGLEKATGGAYNIDTDSNEAISESVALVDGAIGTEYADGNGVPELDNIRAHTFKTGGKGGGRATKTITYDGSVSYEAFTVTGLVEVKVIGYITSALSNHGDATSVGTSTSAAGLIVSTAGTAMQTANTIWIDNTPAKFKAASAITDEGALIGASESITVIGTANLATGTVVLTCFWTPISSDGAIVAV